ncbi:MAG: SulP family inorganic anion transporter [Chitinophagaceae bacterium]|nr:SulP family inorganic anion transporter [Chitinophagaceae bacterium]
MTLKRKCRRFLVFLKINFKYDFPASIVVFLVAVPLCLGISLASGTEIRTGLIAGIVGGIIVGYFSGSHVSVSGPAAGLVVVVSQGIHILDGSFTGFLLATVIAGILQFYFGYIKAGVISQFFPSSVIKGFLASIGVILILKQIPHAFGYDIDPEGDESFSQIDGKNTFTELLEITNNIEPTAVFISILSLFLILFWDNGIKKRFSVFKNIPSSLVVVIAGIIMNQIALLYFSDMGLKEKHLVQFPIMERTSDFLQLLSYPDFSQIYNIKVYEVAFLIAFVASIESLLSLEASEKIDPLKRISSSHQELKAQGIGNITSGLLGGLPITSVIVRTSANVIAGSRSKLSTIFHGILILLSLFFFGKILNFIPFASLVGILIIIGYKLTNISLYKEMYKKGWDQFIPFIVTLISILLSNIIIGISIGFIVGIFFVIKSNYYKSIIFTEDKNKKHYLIQFRHNVSFLNKSIITESFQKIKYGGYVIIDASKVYHMDEDIAEIIRDFVTTGHEKRIVIEIKQTHTNRYILEKYKII